MPNAATKKQALAIADLTSGIFDNGRRGMPRPGCDCEQCFGYCLVDADEAVRRTFGIGIAGRPVNAAGELDFDA